MQKNICLQFKSWRLTIAVYQSKISNFHEVKPIKYKATENTQEQALELTFPRPKDVGETAAPYN